MRRTRALILLIPLGFASLVFAPLVFAPLAHADFSGRILLEDQYFYGSQVAPIEHQQDNYKFEFESKTNFGNSFRVFIEPEIQLSSTPGIVDTPLDFNTRDTYVEAKFLGLHLQIGSFVKSWEGPDGLNPMDIATVKNYRDPLNPENLGSIGAAIGGAFSQMSWELFFVPSQTKSRVPGENSRWLPRRSPFPLQSDGLTLVIPDQPAIQLAGHDELNSALSNNYGGRLQIHSESTDLFLAGFSGSAQLPIFRASLMADSISTHSAVVRNTQIQPVDYRRQTAAVGLVSALSETWVLRIAGRYDQSVGSDSLLPGWSQQFVGGLEKTFSFMDQSILVFAEYAYGVKPEFPAGTLIITDPFKNAILYGLRLPIGDRLVIYYGGLWSHIINAHYDRLRIEKKILEHWSLDLEADLLSGPPINPLGVWANENRVSSGLMYQF